MTSWDALVILIWFGLPAWVGLSTYRLTRFAPEDEPQKWEGLSPTLFRGLFLCVVGHLLYARAAPYLHARLPAIWMAGPPRAGDPKRLVLDPHLLVTLLGVVVVTAVVGAASGLIGGWGWRLWRRLRRRATLSPRPVWDEVFDGEQARWVVLHLSGGKIYEGLVERWSGSDEPDPHLLLTSPSEYLQIETRTGSQWHVLDLQSDGLLIPRSRIELVELRPTEAEWQAHQRGERELATMAEAA